MARTLNGITLPWQIQWTEEFQQDYVESTIERDMQGRLVIFQAQLHKGRHITLEATEDLSWFDSSFATSMLALSNIVNATMDFVWDDYTASVVFRHADKPVVDIRRLQPFSDQLVGTIKLMEV